MRHFPGLRKVRQTVFLRCGKLPAGGVPSASMRRGLWLCTYWRSGFGAPRHRRRIRHGGRHEPEHDRAGDRRQPKLCRINLCRWCSWRRARRTTATAGTGAAAIPHEVNRSVRSAFGGPPVAMRKVRHQNGREPTYARGDTGAGIQLPGDATSLVTGPGRTARELEDKSGRWRRPDRRRRRLIGPSKNKTLRNRAFREIVW
jgi:hypothetical protein